MSNESGPAATGRPRTPILHKRAQEPGGSGRDDQGTGANEAGAESGARLYYVLARDGLYIGRNHEFFRSCVPAPAGPSELDEQEPFLEPNFPVIPRASMEQVVGFFDRIADLHVSEASVLLAWDRKAQRVRIVVPEQTATVSRWSDGYRTPVGLYYYPPADLPRDWVLFGDVHSHVDMSAYSSATDQADEEHDAGLHIVVGRLYKEPPEFHVEAVVDGMRFKLELDDVAEGYEDRNLEVPREWIDRVQVESAPVWSSGSVYGSGAWTQPATKREGAK